MKKIVLAVLAIATFAFADNFTDEALRKGDSMTVSDKSHNNNVQSVPEQMTATPSEIKDAASSVESIKPAPVKSVKVVKNTVKPVKSVQKTKKIAKKHIKTKKIAKKSTKKAHKKVTKKIHKKHNKKA